ncbi:MAG: ribonuclease HII [Propionibacteriaceae bacterium]|jgi:ribonuclease HII|uniref:Ribonuclease HII n=2 Tax=root TaxID=1 RepID=A0AAN0K5X4_9ACTN|nr:ribonuclease HII [Brooklawnia sp. SH051]MCB0885026.1 ribonuclease HII [Propionibacteriaceae bacterium]MEA5120029.1 ribonuclease HII [Propionibacterium sp.]NLI83861.1 ribonuclease HII [Propionibacterium sp.]BEH01096.1 ribonuclease HII [Brooklawnia sp. SH051]
MSTIRPGKGIFGYERALWRAGFDLVAGADEAGRGACAGPLVAGAVILDERAVRHLDGLNDSKLLSAATRERLYDEIVACALAWSAVEVSPSECDQLGMHEADLQGLRRALLRLDPQPGFALTDGFAVSGLACPGLAVWKGDQVAACVAAASIIAKVTRDRIMIDYDAQYEGYGFAEHKGYCTAEHQRRLEDLGPCPIHRLRYENVQAAARVASQ